MTLIPKEEYIKMVDALPILCVDIVLQNSKSEYLLVKRANEPLKDQWWVIGGRVLKCENVQEAAFRKIREETGVEVKSVKPLGYYEDIFDENSFNLDMKTHTLSIVYKASVDDDLVIKLDNQSREWRYFSELPDRLRIVPFNL